MTNASLGIQLRLLSGLFFAAMGICVKELAAVPLGEIMFFRAFFALIPLVIFLWVRGEFPHGLRTTRPVGHLVRSVFGALAMFTSFAAIVRLPIAEATLISYLSPPLMMGFAALFLREALTPARIAAIGFGMAGVVVLVAPDLGGGEHDATRIAGYVYGLITAVLTAAALTMVRSLARSEAPGAIGFYFVVVSMIGGLMTLPGGWMMPDLWSLSLLVASGLFGGMAHISMTLAFRYAEAARLAPLDYVSLVWVGLADVLIFGAALAGTFPLALLLVLIGAALPLLEARRSATA